MALTYTFQMPGNTALRPVTVFNSAGVQQTTGTLDGDAIFTAELEVGDYYARASSGRTTYEQAGTVDRGDEDAFGSGGGGGVVVTAANVRTAQSFGVTADARMVTAAVAITGTAATAAAATFTSADIGRTIAAYSLTGTVRQAVITAVASGTAATLGTAPGDIAGALAVIGTDDTAAWQDAIDWGYGSDEGHVVTFDGSAMSLIAGPQVSGSVTATNAPAIGQVYPYTGQLLIPAHAATGRQRVMEIRGTIPFGGLWDPYVGLSGPAPTTGLILLSTATSGNVVDVISDPEGYVFHEGPFSWVQFNMRRATMRKLPATGGTWLNILNAASGSLREVTADRTDAPTTWPVSTGNNTRDGSAIVLPGDGNWGISELFQFGITGYPKGLAMSSSACVDQGSILHCGAAIALGTPASDNRFVDDHSSRINRVFMQFSNTVHIEVLGRREITGMVEMEIANTPLFLDDPQGKVMGELLIGGTDIDSVAVNSAASGKLFFRTTKNPVQGNPSTAVKDSLERITAVGTAFGLADGSNHVYFPVGMKTAANGAHVSGNSFCFAGLSNGPLWASRKIAVDVVPSGTAGRTFIGLGTRAGGADYDMIKMYASNTSAVGNGLYLFKGDRLTSTPLANAAFTFNPGVTYRIAMVAQEDPVTGVVTINGLIDGASVLSYTLTSGEAAAYPSTGYDCLQGYPGATLDDGGSRLKNFTVTPI